MSVGRFTTRWGHRNSAVEAELITRLRQLPGPAPEARFRSELRAQLVAITARIVSESATAEAAAGTPASTVAGDRRSPAGGRALHRLRRPVLALAGASTVLVLLLGMAVWMAGGSLPGQSLYGVKRASENVQLSMAGTDTAKGKEYLQLAGNRVREVADLLSQPSAMLAAGGVSADGRQVSPHTASLITDTLASADDDSVNGMQLLGRAAVAQLSKEPLTKLTDWLPGQRSLLTEVRDRLPAGTLRTRAQASMLLLQRIATRTTQLSNAMGCPCLAQSLADELGPLPCGGCGTVHSPVPGGSPGTVPVPIPGLGATGSSSSLPNLSLPPLGGSGSSTSGGHAVGTAGSPSSAGAGLPTALTVTTPAQLPSSQPTGGGATSSQPAVIGGPPSTTVPLPLPSVPTSVGGSVSSPALPVPLPPLPSVSP